MVKQGKTLVELNIIMAEQIDGLIAGTTPVAVAEATTNTIGKVFAGAKLQLDYARLIGGKSPRVSMLVDGG